MTLRPAALLLLAACASTPDVKPTAVVVDEDAPAPAQFADMRARPTHLLHHGPAPDPPSGLALPNDPTVEWERTTYPSAGRSLTALLARPPTTPRGPDDEPERLPAVIVFHGGFSLANDQLAWSKPFVDAGFIVMFPTLRGENGNPGEYELMYGELDDATAAARFLAQEPDVDVVRLYAVGHSVGGGLCALLAVDGNAPFRMLGSIAGAYAPAVFLGWQAGQPTLVPFDTRDLVERQLRALTPFVEQLHVPLVLYVGTNDASTRAVARVVEGRAKKAGRALDVIEVPGDHMSSIAPALADFAARIAKDADAAAQHAAPHVALR